MGQIRGARVGVFGMHVPGKNHQDHGEAHKTFGFRPADKAEGHERAAKEQHDRDQQADHPQGAEQRIGEPRTHRSAHISVGFARRGDLRRVARVVGKESKAAKNTRGKNHKPKQLKECTLLRLGFLDQRLQRGHNSQRFHRIRIVPWGPNSRPTPGCRLIDRDTSPLTVCSARDVPSWDGRRGEPRRCGCSCW